MIQYKVGIPKALRASAAILYDEVFGAKFAVAISNRDKRIALLTDVLNVTHRIAAIEEDQLIGLAGFHSTAGSLAAGITFQKLIAHVGVVEGL